MADPHKRTTALTKIDKQYKDKKTGEWKTLTIEYAKVNDRLLEFRQDNPRGLIDTHPEILATGDILFKARIVKDQSDTASASATGHAYGSQEGEKSFEKLETIAVGRALALLGYGAKGEIASAEEMQEFQQYQENKRSEIILEWTGRLSEANTLAELGKVWTEVPGVIKKDLLAHKEDLKKRFTDTMVDAVASSHPGPQEAPAPKPPVKKPVAKKAAAPETPPLIPNDNEHVDASH